MHGEKVREAHRLRPSLNASSSSCGGLAGASILNEKPSCAAGQAASLRLHQRPGGIEPRRLQSPPSMWRIFKDLVSRG
jgi:hypothetical protein